MIKTGIQTYFVMGDNGIRPWFSAIFQVPLRHSFAVFGGCLCFFLNNGIISFVSCFGFNHKDACFCFNDEVRLITSDTSWTIVNIKLLWGRAKPFLNGFIVFQDDSKFTFRIAVKLIKCMTSLCKTVEYFFPYFIGRNIGT